MELLADLKDRDPSLQRTQRGRKPVFRKVGLSPTSLAVLPPNSRGRSLHSLESKVSIPLSEKGGSLIFLVLFVSSGHTDWRHHPFTTTLRRLNNTLRVWRAREECRPFGKPGQDTPTNTEMLLAMVPVALPRLRCAKLAGRHVWVRSLSEPTLACTNLLLGPRAAASANYHMDA